MKKKIINQKLSLHKHSIVALNPATAACIKGGDTVQQGDTFLAPPDTFVHPPDTLINPPDKPATPPDTMTPIRDTFVQGR